MNKRYQVELEAAFVKFMDIADSLGFDFVPLTKLELHHRSNSIRDVGGNVNLLPTTYIDKEKKEKRNDDS